MDGYLNIENIDTHDVPEYLSLDEYQRMKTAGVIFPPEIIAIYENTNDSEEVTEPTVEETPTETPTETEQASEEE